MVACNFSSNKSRIKLFCVLCGKLFLEKEMNMLKICSVCKPLAENRYLKLFCEKCKYDKCRKALDIHHVDRNHNNNKFSNLMVLCANCHREEHAGDNDFSFKKVYDELKDKRNVA